ncbi:hypothetical protein [Pseudomonas fluorescens]|uniref:hypothetical protein n=1 Tax=Pseudomonas fluorescens TaxID=294 RepID=UPI0011B26F75|nr:hypothetical protein [Pseudomonas fluorescens]
MQPYQNTSNTLIVQGNHEGQTSREQLFRDLMGLAVQLESILVDEVVPMMQAAGHPLAGRVHSLRSEIKLRALLLGGAV